ncbi:Nucleolar, Nop52 [Corchorus capsularis]|uniref:Nucleolar, Nop52 n=1 Tax=Corchorus capsularis TaxID=210143 RepID=A0A1R3FYM1_COCAP|nr:Nucleolar, Nop52 [Corchorus capsularis]
MTGSGAGDGPALIKQLAACDKSTRDRAVRSLINTWLPSQAEVSDEEMKKLWKGLFYCVWHADKFPAQSDLIEKLSTVLPNLEPALFLQYFSVFLLTMRREWTGIDRLRPFLPVRKEVAEVLLEPFLEIMGKVSDKVLVGKIRSNVFDEFIEMGRRLLEVKKSGEEVDEGDDVVVLGTISLLMGFSTKFYELGSSADCCQGNRKVVLGLYAIFLKLEKDLASLGIDISIPEVNEGDEEDEVPQLIPITSGMEVDGSDGVPEPVEVNANGSIKKASKKNKKAKKATEGSGKKAKKTKNVESSLADEENNVAVPAESANSGIEQNGDGDSITFTESVISNLQLQFEKVAAEVGLGGDVASACDLPKVNGAVTKKRKRGKSMDGQKSKNGEITNQGDGEDGETVKTGEKSTKRVRFSMKNNLVWKPHSPMPPQSLRLPPSATPRGSALKKGLSPGPIREMPPMTKKVKKAKSVKKARKVIKSVPLVKRARKLRSASIGL